MQYSWYFDDFTIHLQVAEKRKQKNIDRVTLIAVGVLQYSSIPNPKFFWAFIDNLHHNTIF
jgi:hypothetical protein